MQKTLSLPADLAETEARLLAVCEEDKPLWGGMDAPQMMRHVAQCLEMATGDRTIPSADGKSHRVLKWLALRSNLRWQKNMKAPEEVVTALRTDDGIPFEEQKVRAVESLRELALGRRVAATHPFFGTMTVEDWTRWGYLHTDHHLRQFGH